MVRMPMTSLLVALVVVVVSPVVVVVGGGCVVDEAFKAKRVLDGQEHE